MAKYVLKKTASVAVTLLLVSFLVFAAFALIPGDPASRKLGTNGTPEQIIALREEMGLNAPLPVRYVRWASGMLRGDMGKSYTYLTPVSELVGDSIPVTASLALFAFVLTVLISFPLGIYTAKHENSLPDRVILVMNQVIMSLPPFFSGILISAVFGMMFKWFVPGAYVSYQKSVPAFLAYLFWPALCIALPKASMTIKMLRTSMLEEAAKDYTRTAYSKGNTVNGVMYGHLLKNALLPVVTFLGMVLADMVAGSIVVETIFSVPGVSNMLINSITNRDYPVVLAIITGMALLIMLINLAVDVLYRLLDPRIRVSGD